MTYLLLLCLLAQPQAQDAQVVTLPMTVPLSSLPPIHRSRAVRRAFQRMHPCPSTGMRTGACKGYVVDHVIALECGGPDAVENMQWETVAEGKAKDKTERLCKQ